MTLHFIWQPLTGINPSLVFMIRCTTACHIGGIYRYIPDIWTWQLNCFRHHDIPGIYYDLSYDMFFETGRSGPQQNCAWNAVAGFDPIELQHQQSGECIFCYLCIHFLYFLQILLNFITYFAYFCSNMSYSLEMTYFAYCSAYSAFFFYVFACIFACIFVCIFYCIFCIFYIFICIFF